MCSFKPLMETVEKSSDILQELYSFLYGYVLTNEHYDSFHRISDNIETQEQATKFDEEFLKYNWPTTVLVELFINGNYWSPIFFEKYPEIIQGLYSFLDKNTPTEEYYLLFLRVMGEITNFEQTTKFGKELLKYNWPITVLKELFPNVGYSWSYISFETGNWIILMLIDKYPELDNHLRSLMWYHDPRDTVRFLGLDNTYKSQWVIVPYLICHQNVLTRDIILRLTYDSDLIGTPEIDEILDKSISVKDIASRWVIRINKYISNEESTFKRDEVVDKFIEITSKW